MAPFLRVWEKSTSHQARAQNIPAAASCLAGFRRGPGALILLGDGEKSMAGRDREENRFSARAARYARVGANVGGVAARIAGARLFGADGSAPGNAAALARALGGLK